MSFRSFVIVAAAWLCLAQQAESVDNDNTLQDMVSKLSEEVTKLQKQMANQLSDQRDMMKEITNFRRQMAEQTSEIKMQRQESYVIVKQIEKQNEEIKQIEIRATEGATKEQSTNGPVFIRWGRKTCNGTGSELVYTGSAGGTGSSYTGGSASLLCLSRNPTYGNHDDVLHFQSNLRGAEYQIDPDSNFPFETTSPLLADNDIPCAACQVTNGSTVMMIPGTMNCNPDWRMEYRGYIMTTVVTGGTETKNQFICVDENAEVGFNGGANGHGARFVPAEGDCDGTSLPCPPYVNFWEITCAVCSK